MEVVIDRETCGNCQLCADACPEVFEVLDGGIVLRRESVPSAFQTDCLFARDSCPAQAIELLDTAGTFRDDWR